MIYVLKYNTVMRKCKIQYYINICTCVEIYVESVL